MVALSIGPISIYRYGIAYAIAFLAGYLWIYYLIKKNIFKDQFPRVHTFLQHHLDDLMITIFLGVVIGGRLGHVLIYDFAYYLEHPREIRQVWK